MTDASPTSTPSVENVTEAQQYNQILRDIAVSQTDQIADYIGHYQLPDDLDGIEERVRSARLQLELVEAMLATRREVADDE
jgi:hypothetical protein